MKILLINPSTDKYTRSNAAPLGLLSIATYLKSFGYSVKIYDKTIDKTPIDVIINDFNPTVCGISLVSYKSVEDMLNLVKTLKINKIPVIVGGPFASVLPEVILSCDMVDAVSLGEGEETWRELIEYYKGNIPSLNQISGLVFKNAAKEFLNILFYSHFFVSVKKKYKLK